MDKLLRYTSEAGIRISIALTTDTVEEARRRHDLWPVATAALGRTMTGALLIGGIMKNKETVSVRIDGGGPLGSVHVDAFTETGAVRGYVDNPHVDVPLVRAGKLNVGAAVGNDGTIQVSRFQGRELIYTSQSPLQSGEIAEDFAYYLYTSEQVSSTIGLGVLVDTDDTTIVAGGYLVQALPDATDEALDTLEANIAALGPVTAYLKDHPDGSGLVEALYGDLPFNKLVEGSVHFQCTCNKDKFAGVLQLLSDEDKADLIADGQAELVCHYCNTAYTFTKEELESL